MCQAEEVFKNFQDAQVRWTHYASHGELMTNFRFNLSEYNEGLDYFSSVYRNTYTGLEGSIAGNLEGNLRLGLAKRWRNLYTIFDYDPNSSDMGFRISASPTQKMRVNAYYKTASESMGGRINYNLNRTISVYGDIAKRRENYTLRSGIMLNFTTRSREKRERGYEKPLDMMEDDKPLTFNE